MYVSPLLKKALCCGLAFAAVGGLSSLRARTAGASGSARTAGTARRAEELKVEVYQVADLPVWHVSPGFSPRYDGSLLVAHLREIVDDGSWVRGSIEEFPSTASLVITQTRANHDRISRTLERMREQRRIAVQKAAAAN